MEQFIKEVFPERLKKLCEYRGVNFSEVARRIDKTPAYIAKLARGEAVPSLDTIEAISNALNMKVSYFFEPNIETNNQMPLENLLTNYDPEIRGWLANEAKGSYVVFAKKVQDANLTDEQMQIILDLIKKYK